MKKLSLLLLILSTSFVFSQKTIEKETGDFNKLKVYDLIEVELIKSDQNKVLITGIDLRNVLVNNKNGTLKIKMKLEEIFDGKNVNVKLYYKQLDVIDVNEGAKVHSKDVINQNSIALKAQEGGKINLDLNVTNINIKSVTGGSIKTNGSANYQDISLLTGGIYEGETLETKQTTVTINAAGEAYVHAKELADIKIRAGGNVYIYGNPTKVNESTVLGGKIKRM